MVQPDSEPVEVFRAANIPQAHVVRLALEEGGLHVILEGELLQGAVGELPVGWPTSPRIMVPREEAEQALHILRGMDLHEGPGGESPPPEENRCLSCGAVIPAEENRCPACGWSYVGDEETT